MIKVVCVLLKMSKIHILIFSRVTCVYSTRVYIIIGTFIYSYISIFVRCIHVCLHHMPFCFLLLIYSSMLSESILLKLYIYICIAISSYNYDSTHFSLLKIRVSGFATINDIVLYHIISVYRYIYYPFWRGARLYTSVSHVRKRQILTYKESPRTERVKMFITDVDSYHRYSYRTQRAS